MYEALHGMAPDYLRELCRSVSEDDARGSLRSAERSDLIIPKVATKFGDRAFAVSGPLLWNSLPTSQKFQHLVKLQICFEVSLVYLTILEAAPTVTICDGALESVFTCYGAIEIIVLLLVLLLHW